MGIHKKIMGYRAKTIIKGYREGFTLRGNVKLLFLEFTLFVIEWFKYRRMFFELNKDAEYFEKKAEEIKEILGSIELKPEI